MTSDTALEQPMFGNWRRAVSVGVGKLGVVGLLILFGGSLLLLFLLKFVGIPQAAVGGVLLALVLWLVTARDQHHRTLLQRLFTRLAYRWARIRGATIYRSGPTSFIPYHGFELPGLAAGMQVSTWTDRGGKDFALLHHPADHSYAASLTSEPQGGELVDDEQREQWVAHYGGLLGSLTNEPNLVGAAVTIVTERDPGTRLRTEVEGATDPGSHPIAQAMLRECVETYPSGSASTTSWMSLTFTGTATGNGKRLSTEDMAAKIGARLPGLYRRLSGTGAGAVAPASSAELAEAMMVAYDPLQRAVIDRMRAAGEPIDLAWSDVGPAATDAAYDHLRHGRNVSVTYGMSLPPQGEVFSNVLMQLLEPIPEVDRKAVTIVYEPIAAGRAPDLAQADVNNAATRAGSMRRPTERVKNDLGAAQANAKANAKGAGLLNFGLVVTATVTDPDRYSEMVAAMDNAIGSARLRCRVLEGSQDSAFLFGQAGLLGLVPARHRIVPVELGESL